MRRAQPTAAPRGRGARAAQQLLRHDVGNGADLDAQNAVVPALDAPLRPRAPHRAHCGPPSPMLSTYLTARAGRLAAAIVKRGGGGGGNPARPPA
eukprot:gene15688-18511_t